MVLSSQTMENFPGMPENVGFRITQRWVPTQLQGSLAAGLGQINGLSEHKALICKMGITRASWGQQCNKRKHL